MSPMHFAVATIGWSHLLQPPVTLWLARRVLGLDRAFAALPPLAGRIAQIMALTAITLPTVLGAICGAYPDAVLLPGPTRCVAFLVAGGLWTPRLLAQLLWVGPAFPKSALGWHVLLVSIFFVQGPFFLSLLIWGPR